MLALVLSLALATSPTFDERRFSLATDVGGSIMSQSLEFALEGRLRLGRFGILLRADWNPWISLYQASAGLKQGTFNIGVGGEVRYFGARMRTGLYVGASILLFKSALDLPGQTGPYLGVLPAGFLFPLGTRFKLRLEPLSLFVLAPSLRSIPLIVLQFRTTVGLELAL